MMKKSLVHIPSLKEIKKNAPGVVVGIYQGKNTLLEHEIGFSNIMTSEPISKNQHFRIGSLTKTVVTTVILCLVDRGFFSLDDKVSSFFRDEARTWMRTLPKTLTILHLGNMTSGLFNYSEDATFQKAISDNPSIEWTAEELLSFSLDGRNNHYFEPGLGWYYTNTNLILLGRIAEKVTGETIESLCEELVFTPLKMKNSFAATSNEMPVPFSRGYMYGYADGRAPTSVLRDVTNNSPSWANAAGFCISTLGDLRTYIPAFVNGLLLSEKVLKQRNESFVQLTFAEYGFGLHREEGRWYGHNGAIPGYQTFASYCPQFDVTVLVLSNVQSELSGINPSDTIGGEIVKAFEAAYEKDKSLHFQVL